MLECPFCGERLAQQGRDSWFECPSCGNWIRRRINRNGIVWFEAGVFVSGNIQPVQVPSRQVQPPQPARSPSQGPPRDLPNIDQMDLPAVQAERSRIEARLRELEAEIQRASRARTQNPTGEQLRRYNAELRQCLDEQERLQNRDQLLQERVTALQAQQAQARQSGSSGPAFGFIFGFLLAAGVLYAFTRMINLSLDPRAIGIAVLIAAASGFVTFFIALFL
jgi:DNA repair exonuclease SbcCD ATPase subunit